MTDALELDGVVDERPKRRAIGVWHHQKGTDRMDREVLLRARRHNIPIVYDDHGHTAVVAKKIQPQRRARSSSVRSPATSRSPPSRSCRAWRTAP